MVNYEGEPPVFVTNNLFEKRLRDGLLGIHLNKRIENGIDVPKNERSVFVTDVQSIIDVEKGMVYYEDYDAETQISTLGVDEVETVG